MRVAAASVAHARHWTKGQQRVPPHLFLIPSARCCDQTALGRDLLRIAHLDRDGGFSVASTIVRSNWLAAPSARIEHICAFFNGPDEEQRMLRPFIKEGLDSGEKSLHIVDPKARDDYLRRLRASEIQVDESMAAGQLEVVSWDEAHIRGGRFDAVLHALVGRRSADARMPPHIRERESSLTWSGRCSISQASRICWSMRPV